MGFMNISGKSKVNTISSYQHMLPWMRITPQDICEQILELAKKELTPSQISIYLRNFCDIKPVKNITVNKILRILKSYGLAPEIPEDLHHLIKKATTVRKHLEWNCHDKDAEFRLMLIELRIRRRARYYKIAKGSYSEFETFLMSLDIPNIIIPDCDLKQFEKIAFLNSRFLRMSLIEGQLEIIMPPLPVHVETGNFKLFYRLAGGAKPIKVQFGSVSAFRLLRLENPDSPDKPTILSPDTAVILKTRWDSLTNEEKKLSFPPVAPNFIIELRVDEGISIDLITNPPEVRIYTFNSDTNKVIWKSLVKPDQVESEVLKGFVLDMQEIYWQ
ncbi:29455_t:CDS:2 [Racocetra persica]|uniref:29455_t:CDS:1 n=1 Tax=Racocetra persica TaxID=160502 RepID=A0ACA9KIZ5_9GLOM|nr:29455_t:CDS:2 [Racocetra persica]